jgi:signal transduction histidine kinase
MRSQCDTLKIKQKYLEADKQLSKDLNYSLQLARESYNLSRACPQSRHHVEAAITLVRAFHQLDNGDSMAKILEPLMKNMPSGIGPYLRAKLYHNMSLVDISFMRLEDGLKNALEALKNYELLKDTNNIAGSLVNISNIYQQQRNFKQADLYLRQAEKMVKNKSQIILGNVYITLGILYAENNFLDSAEKFLLLSTEIREKLKDNTSIAWNYNNLGGVYILKGDNKKGILYLKKALEKFKENNNLAGEASIANNLGELYLYEKDYKQAQYYYDYSRSLYNQTHDPDQLENLYYNLYILNDSIGDTKKELAYADSLIALKDSLYGRRLDQRIAEMQTKFDVEKKNLQINNQKADLEIKEKQNKIKNIVIFSIIGLAIVLSLLGLSVYRRKQLEHKAKLDAELIRQQDLRSKAVIEAEEKERVRIARELHDGIGQQLSAAKLNVAALQAASKTEKPEEKMMIQNAVELIDESIKEVRAVSHSMMPSVLIKAGLVSAVREFINKISSTGNLKINLEITGLTERLDNTVETVLFRVLQELVNNIIKHAKASEVGIQFIRHENELTILVEDNGIGFDVSKLNTEDGGIGLKNIQSRIAYLNGEVIFDSYPGKGTTVTIELPLP